MKNRNAMSYRANTPGGKAMRSIRRHVIGATLAGVALVAGVGGWAATTEFAGAVIAPGLVVVDSNVKLVQHATGGIVGEINVRDGDWVEQGELLMRLDATRTRANLALVTKQLDRLAVREARLRAERDGAGDFDVPFQVALRGTAEAGRKGIADAIASERDLFQSRTAAREGRRQQLGERIRQYEEEIAGSRHQATAKADELVIVQKELDGLRKLLKRKLVDVARVNSLEREAVKLAGEQARLETDIARTNGKISELRLQLMQIDQELREEVTTELREIESERAMLVEKRVTAKDELRRVDVRAPVTGRVHESSVHTVGGVISPADTLMQIVPGNEALSVRVHVQPQDIDQLYEGQQAMLRFSAFSQRDTPEVAGRVQRIAADLTTDPGTLNSYYVVGIELDAVEMTKLGDVTLVPGMPAESFISTTRRTVLSFVTKPFLDQVLRAFREG